MTEIIPVFSTVLLPSPVAVVRTFIRLLINGELLRHVQASVVRIIYATALALGLGVPLGLAMGLSRSIHDLADVVLTAVRPIPPLAWIPLAILWFGIGSVSVIFITFLSSFFAVVLNTIAGARSIERIHIRAAAMLGASRRRLLTHVVLPSLLPHVFTGFRVAIGASWMSIVAGELIAASSGLGYMIWFYREVLRSDAILVGMLTIGGIGILMDVATRRLERWLLPWRVGLYLR